MLFRSGELSSTPGERLHLRSLPCSLNLARPHQPPSTRPIESPYAGSFLALSPARPKWAPRLVSLLGCTAHDGKSALNITLNWALPPPTPASHLLFHQLSRGRPPSYLLLLLLCIVRFVSPFTPSSAVPVVLSLLPLLFPLSAFHGPMGRKRTTEEYNRTA